MLTLTQIFFSSLQPTSAQFEQTDKVKLNNFIIQAAKLSQLVICLSKNGIVGWYVLMEDSQVANDFYSTYYGKGKGSTCR